MNTHVTRPRTSLFVLKISGFHVKLSTRNRVHSPADSLGRFTPRAHALKGVLLNSAPPDTCEPSGRSQRPVCQRSRFRNLFLKHRTLYSFPSTKTRRRGNFPSAPDIRNLQHRIASPSQQCCHIYRKVHHSIFNLQILGMQNDRHITLHLVFRHGLYHITAIKSQRNCTVPRLS